MKKKEFEKVLQAVQYIAGADIQYEIDVAREKAVFRSERFQIEYLRIFDWIERKIIFSNFQNQKESVTAFRFKPASIDFEAFVLGDLGVLLCSDLLFEEFHSFFTAEGKFGNVTVYKKYTDMSTGTVTWYGDFEDGVEYVEYLDRFEFFEKRIQEIEYFHDVSVTFSTFSEKDPTGVCEKDSDEAVVGSLRVSVGNTVAFYHWYEKAPFEKPRLLQRLSSNLKTGGFETKTWKLLNVPMLYYTMLVDIELAILSGRFH